MTDRHYRAHQRFMVQLPVTIRATSRGMQSKGMTSDLGIGGTACVLDTPLRLGEEVEVTLESQVTTVIQGQVAWVAWAESSAVRLGVRFNPGSESELGSILDALGVAA